VIEVLEFVQSNGVSPFARWFAGLDDVAAARVTAAVVRLAAGHSGSTKSVGRGVMEYRIDHGPGYRIYFGRDGETVVILLAGGTKQRQQVDIESAWSRWSDYKARKSKARKSKERG
jgi:putative addiction module killer protein